MLDIGSWNLKLKHCPFIFLSRKFGNVSLISLPVARKIRYVKSRNDEQLKDPNSQSGSGCKPEDTVNGSVIVPCGLIAWSLFNDTYSFSRNNQQVAVNKKGISWKSDRNHKFGKDVFPKNFQNGTLIGGAHLNPSIPVSFSSPCL